MTRGFFKPIIERSKAKPKQFSNYFFTKYLLTHFSTGILQGVYWGLGTGSGTITGGFLIHHIGTVAAFRCVACSSFVVCILFCLAQCKWTRESTEYADMKYTYLPTVESKDTEELLRGYRVSKTSKNKHSTTRRY